MANNVLGFIIDFKVQENSRANPVKRIENITYATLFKTGYTGDNFVVVTDKLDLPNYLETPYLECAQEFFNNGLNRLYLLLKEDNSVEWSQEDITEANKQTYSMVISSGTEPTTLELSAFDGVKSINSNSNPLTQEVIDFASGINQNVTMVNNSIDPLEEALHCAIFGRLVANFTTDINAMQFDDFSGYTPLFDITAAEEPREKQLTFIVKDDTSVLYPALAYFRVGGYSITRPYIIESLKTDIQEVIFNSIARNKLKYDNKGISYLETKAEDIINIYIERRYISSANFTIPPVSEQSEADIINGFLDNIVLDESVNSDIWALKGTIKLEG